MKPRILFPFISVLCMLFIASSALADQVITGNKKPIQVLFTQIAGSATLSQDPVKDNQYTLKMHDVNKEVVWFSDRPDRKTGNVSLEHFISSWKQKGADSFAKDHPNASLVAVTENKDGIKTTLSGVFVLSNPIYNAENKTLSYNIQDIGQNKNFGQTIQLKNAALFIDSANCFVLDPNC